MKRLLASIIAIAFMFCTFSFAEGLDLSSFTPEQLAVLQQIISAELESQEPEAGFDNSVDVLFAMAAANAPINKDKLIDYTAETDPNELLGTVGSYTAKTDFGCVGYASDAEGPVGGTLEYFPDEQHAQNRYNYLMDISIATPMFADRILYKVGNFVLRTDRTLETADAIAIVHGFEGVIGENIEEVFDPSGEITLEYLRGEVVVEPTSKPEVQAVASEPINASEFAELKRGNKGTDVAKLQTRLKSTGFLSGLADGDFGPATEKAVRAFEIANGLEENGVASQSDQMILFESGVICADGSIAKAYDPYEVCPIEISRVDLKNSYGYNYVSFSAKNISTQNVKAVSCTIRYFDAFGDRISDYGTSEQTVSIADIAVGKSVSYSTRDDYSMLVSDASIAGVAVTRVLMDDGTNLIYDDPVWFEGK